MKNESKSWICSEMFIFIFSIRQTKDGLVDATPEVRKSLEDTLNKLKNAYGAESEDLLSVPKLDFKGKISFLGFYIEDIIGLFRTSTRGCD